MATLIAIDFVSDFSLYNSSNADLIIVNDDARTSGNTFQWQSTGTANGGTVYAGSTGFWHMMFTGHASVKWYGATGDGITDDSAAIQATLDNHGSIFIPATKKMYLCNVFAKGQSIFGEKTVKIEEWDPELSAMDLKTYRSHLRSYESGGYALHLGYHDLWDYVPVNDIWISGNLESNGVQFDNKGASDPYAGRWVLNNVTFFNCVTGINKSNGNIGNTFNSCCFSGGSYHYYAQSYQHFNQYNVMDDVMHTGCDSFNYCNFDSSSKAAIYIDQYYMGCGQHTFNECVFQGNAGFVIFVEKYSWNTAIPLTISNCWFESNSSYTSVDINGTSYEPYELRFNEMRSAVINNCGVGSLYASNSVVRLNHCATGGGKFYVDAQSVVTAYGGIGGGDVLDFYYDYPPEDFAGGAGPTGGFIKMKPRTKVSQRHSDKVIAAETFGNADSWYFSGWSNIDAHRVKDGTSSDSCAELIIGSNIANVHVGTLFTPPADSTKYLLWMYDLKRVSGEPPLVAVCNYASYTKHIYMDTPVGEWVTLCGCGLIDITNIHETGFYLQNDTANDIVVRIGGVSFMLFDTAAEAIEALASRELFVRNTTPVVIEGTQSPASAALAATWNVGDRCVNTAPSTGNPKGWICTVAGTPGTWVSEGNL